MADHQIHQAHQLRDEEYESEDSETEDGVRADFAADIFIEKAHMRARILAWSFGARDELRFVFARMWTIAEDES